MARPLKNSLLYFPLDVDFFRNKKIRALKVRFGTKGITLYIYILCLIYGEKGYYTQIDEYFYERITDDTGISEQTTRQILKYLCERSMFNDKLFISVKILTSATIQQTYQEAKKGLKRDIKVNADYWLLDQSETLSFIKVTHFKGFSENNDSFSKKNPDYSENNDTKENRVDYSILNNTKTEYSDVVVQKIIDMYQSNIAPIVPIIADNIALWLKKVDADVIEWAINEAVKRNKRNWSYISGILDNHFNAGNTSLEQVKNSKRAYNTNPHSFNVYEDNTGFDYDSIEDIMKKYDK